MNTPSYRDALKKGLSSKPIQATREPLLDQVASCPDLDPGDLASMAGLDTTHGVDPYYIPMASHPLAPITDVIQEITTVSIALQADKVIGNDGYLIAQTVPFAENSTKSVVNLNDTVVRNTKKLEMENSSLE
ncbi:hypothetical protein Ancab_034180 [Ancistrocladus abbreviatus]